MDNPERFGIVDYENNIKSLEARIMPGFTVRNMSKIISDNDSMIDFASNNDKEKYFMSHILLKEPSVTENCQKMIAGYSVQEIGN